MTMTEIKVDHPEIERNPETMRNESKHERTKLE